MDSKIDILSVEKWNLEEEQKKLLAMGDKAKKYVMHGFDAAQLKEIRLGLEDDLDVSQYAHLKNDWFVMYDIRNGLKYGFDAEDFLKKGFNRLQINEIIAGYESNVDVSKYADLKYDFLQMTQLRLGLQENIDISCYANPEYDNVVMRETRLSLKSHVNILPYVKKGVSGNVLKQLRIALEHSVDIISYVDDGYDEEQLKEIREAKEEGQNIEKYISKEFFGMQLYQIRLGVQSGIDVSIYATGEYNWLQMREIRVGLEEHLEIKNYLKPFFSWAQMEQIRIGMEEYLDVSSYAKIRYTPKEMEKFRLDLLKEKEKSESNQIKINMDNVPESEINKILLSNSDINKPINQSENVVSVTAEISEKITDEVLGQLKKGTPIKCECGNIYVSQDNMEVSLELNPPSKVVYTETYIAKQLVDCGIRQGIDHECIKEMIFKGLYNTNMIVAKGKLPIDGDDGHFEYYFRTILPTVPKLLPDGSVDYFEMDLIETVSNGQKIAEYIPPTTGQYGYTVKGKLLAPKKGKDLLPIKGKGFVLSEDRKKYYSSMDGKIVLTEDGKIEITRMLNIPGNVDYSVGNIDFDGDIFINGDVLSGFSVTATGNIQISGHIENAILKSGKNVIAKSGMNGGNEGTIEAKGNVMGSYFESTNIIVKGNLKANYLMNCCIFSESKVVVTGKKGLIVGGNIKASGGVEVFTLGNISQIKTQITVGADNEIMLKYYDVNKNIKKVTNELEILEKGKKEVSKLIEINQSNAVEMYKKILLAIKIKKEEIAEIEAEKQNIDKIVEKGSKSKVIVRGKVYPGVKIIIDLKEINVNQIYCNIYAGKSKEKTGLFKLK